MIKHFKTILKNIPLFITIAVISIASIAFGLRMINRSQGSFLLEKKNKIVSNWGGDLAQQSPQLNSYQARKMVNILPDGEEEETTAKGAEVNNVKILNSHIDAKLNMDYRRKGLTFFPTFVSNITAEYKLKNESEEVVESNFSFPLPTQNSLVWNAEIKVDGKENETQVSEKGLSWQGEIEPNQEKIITIKYSARGLNQFSYTVSKTKGSQDFSMDLSVNGADKIDFPEGALSPSKINERENGWDLSWKFDNVLSSPSITVKMFAKQNISDQIARLFWFVPLLLMGYIASLKGLAEFRKQKIKTFDLILLSALYTIFFPFVAYLVSVFTRLSVFSGLGIAFGVITPIILYFLQFLFDFKFVITRGLLLQLIFSGFFPVALLIPELTGLLAIIGVIVLLFITVELRRNYKKAK
jgi:hypothetical protein